MVNAAMLFFSLCFVMQLAKAAPACEGNSCQEQIDDSVSLIQLTNSAGNRMPASEQDLKYNSTGAQAIEMKAEDSDLILDNLENLMDVKMATVSASMESKGCADNPALAPIVRGGPRKAIHLSDEDQKQFDTCMKGALDGLDKTFWASTAKKIKMTIGKAVAYAKSPEGMLVAIKTAKTAAAVTMFVVSVACPPAAPVAIGLGMGLNVFFSAMESAHALKFDEKADLKKAAGMFFFNVGKGALITLVGVPLSDFPTVTLAMAFYDMYCTGLADIDGVLDKDPPAPGFTSEAKAYKNCFKPEDVKAAHADHNIRFS